MTECLRKLFGRPKVLLAWISTVKQMRIGVWVIMKNQNGCAIIFSSELPNPLNRVVKRNLCSVDAFVKPQQINSSVALKCDNNPFMFFVLENC